MNDSSHFKYLYADIITFWRFWHITGEILNIPRKYLTAHFMIKYSILSSFPPYFQRNVNISPVFFSVTEGKEKHICIPWCSLFPHWKPRREIACSVFWRKCDGWSVTGYMIPQEANLTAKLLSCIHLSILVGKSLKVQAAEVQLFLCCSEQQNHFPQRKSFELLLLKSVFKTNLLNTLFAWGLKKSADNHTGTHQYLPLSCFDKYISLNSRGFWFNFNSSQCAFSEI